MPRVCLLMLLFAGVVGAAELRNVAVDHVDGRYKLTSEVWFDTDIESIFAVFLDYDLAAQFTSFIVEARNLEPDENGRRRFYIRNQGCAWFFCSTFERSGHVEHEARQFIRSTADPEVSDFEFGLEEWRFQSEGEGTLVAYDFEFEPKFWIPPLIGPYVLQLKLQRDSAGAIHRIEAIAQGLQQ
ncbi:MAG: SRPBCC family protein [Proteobacteria bacterium]|nr:SRPBCC family protein [Pseudomonadota bacterium]